MSHPPVIALGYSEAAMYLRERGDRVGAIVSIAGHFEHHAEWDRCTRIDLKFDDCPSTENPDLIQAMHMKARLAKAREAGLTLCPPTKDDAAAIIAFARSVQGIDRQVLCHCRAGIGRSTAAALICLATWREPGDEEACVEALLTVRPSAQPHRDLVRFADELLAREGRLVAAVESRLQRQ